MASPSSPEQFSRIDSIAPITTPSSVHRSESYGETATALLREGPRRVETGSQDLYRPRSSKENFSSLSREDMIEKKKALEEELDHDEKLHRQPYTRHRADVSDSHPKGPWARKIILSLDGGGVKGYFSLLVLKRLISIIEEFEKGLRPYTLPDRIPEYYTPQPRSDYCIWADKEETQPNGGKIGDEEKQTEPKGRSIGEDEDNNPELLRSNVVAVLRSSQSEDFRLHHYVDYIAGTSTGGLSAIMLARLELSVQRALEQYDIVGNQVFGRPRMLHSTIKIANYVREKYKAEQMENALISVIRDQLPDPQLRLRTDERYQEWKTKYAQGVPFDSDSNRCRTIVIAHGPSETNPNAVEHKYIFRSYDHPHPSPWVDSKHKRTHRNPGPATKAPIWKVGRATSAAPKYFPPIVFEGRTFRDGAIGTNNPSYVALNEVYQMHRYAPKMLLSLGTGLTDKRLNKPQKLTVMKGWRKVGKAMIQIITESEDTATTTEQVCNDHRVFIDYKRWNAPKIGDIKLDEWIPSDSGAETKQKIIDMTVDFLTQPSEHKSLVKYARELVITRRKRATTERWEVFAKRVVYFCPEPECHHEKSTETFSSRDELRDHAVYVHSYISQVYVANYNGLTHTCVYDQCGVDTVHVFSNQKDFKHHLGEVHRLKNPIFMNPNRMEAWLDKGRMDHTEAIRRHHSFKEEPWISSPQFGRKKQRVQTENMSLHNAAVTSISPNPSGSNARQESITFQAG